jgi:hypothetical protein
MSLSAVASAASRMCSWGSNTLTHAAVHAVPGYPPLCTLHESSSRVQLECSFSAASTIAAQRAAAVEAATPPPRSPATAAPTT